METKNIATAVAGARSRLDIGPCIEWQHGKMKRGYGELRLDGKTRYAHRVAYCKHHGIPLESIDGKVVRHRCDNPGCVNPEHLLIGTQHDNMQDKVSRGRQRGPSGVSNKNAKLTDELVRVIRAEYVRFSREFGAVALGKKYGVDPTSILSAAKGKSWQHVDGGEK